MALSIRLTRKGRRHLAFYHVAVFDSRTRREGVPVEDLGFYDPGNTQEPLRLDADKAKQWLAVGAKPSETVASLLKRSGLSSDLWIKARKKAGKPKVRTAAKKAEKAKERKVKGRKKGRTANSKVRAEKKAAAK